MFELLFEITVNICEQFHSLNPISVRQSNAHEVFLLMRRLSIYNRKQKNAKDKPRKIMKPAGDNWF